MTISLFTEDRLRKTPDGKYWSNERRLEGTSWASIVGEHEDVELCVRVSETSEGFGHHVRGSVVELPYYHGILGAIAQLPRVIRRVWRQVGKSSLVVAKCPGIIGSTAVISARLRRKKIAVQLVGDIEDVLLAESQTLLRRIIASIAKQTTRSLVRSADAVRYPTRITLQDKYPPSKRAFSTFFTDANIEVLPPRERCAEFKSGRILAVGSQERLYKGHDTLIRALVKVRKTVPHAHLVLVGNGVQRQNLVELASRLNLIEHVTFIDSIDGWEAMKTTMITAEVFAMPSKTEGLPRALLEAMSLGVACVGSDAGGIPELLEDAAVFPRDDAMALAKILKRIFQDSDFRTQLEAKSRDDVLPYTVKSLQTNMSQWSRTLQSLDQSSA